MWQCYIGGINIGRRSLATDMSCTIVLPSISLIGPYLLAVNNGLALGPAAALYIGPDSPLCSRRGLSVVVNAVFHLLHVLDMSWLYCWTLSQAKVWNLFFTKLVAVWVLQTMKFLLSSPEVVSSLQSRYTVNLLRLYLTVCRFRAFHGSSQSEKILSNSGSR